MWKRLRGALGVATLWGTVWFVGGWALVAILGMPGELAFDQLLRITARFGLLGFFSGGAFSGYLTFSHRNRALSDISTTRVAVAGALVAGLLSPGMAVITGLFGGVCAATCIALAKSAADPLGAGTSTDLLEAPAEGPFVAEDEAI